MTTFLAVFLIAHGLVHLAIWLPQAPTDPAKPPPFRPDHSGPIAATTLPLSTTHRLSAALAAGSAAAFLLSAVGLLLAGTWTTGVLVAAALLGLVLKLAFFSRWLLVGIGIDGLLLSCALLGWPVNV